MDFCSLSYADLKKWVLDHQHKAYLADQIFHWVYQKNIRSFEEMTNVSKKIRNQLEEAFSLSSLKQVQAVDSEETTKFLWHLPDGHFVESVLIRSFDRRTLCVSSQVGCNAKCAFCASGKAGFQRNLTKNEIVEQALLINQILAEKGESISHIVFMGMGEPLENLDAVLFAVEMLTDSKAFALSSRRITISTVGVVPNIDLLTSLSLKVNLVLSLHAPNQHIRKKIIPYARKYPLEDILEAMENYAEKTKRDITYEYILIDGINAEKEHAESLSKLLHKKQCTVNLIPYNTIEGVRFQRPSKKKIGVFEETLKKNRIRVTRRYTKGDKNAAACGQLAFKPKSAVPSKPLLVV